MASNTNKGGLSYQQRWPSYQQRWPVIPTKVAVIPTKVAGYTNRGGRHTNKGGRSYQQRWPSYQQRCPVIPIKVAGHCATITVQQRWPVIPTKVAVIPIMVAGHTNKGGRHTNNGGRSYQQRWPVIPGLWSLSLCNKGGQSYQVLEWSLSLCNKSGRSYPGANIPTTTLVAMLDPSNADFGRPHQILVAHLIEYFSYKNLTTHDIQKVLKKFRCSS